METEQDFDGFETERVEIVIRDVKDGRVVGFGSKVHSLSSIGAYSIPKCRGVRELQNVPLRLEIKNTCLKKAH
jgi:hypothetical protein